jgi:hypothetical protein
VRILRKLCCDRRQFPAEVCGARSVSPGLTTSQRLKHARIHGHGWRHVVAAGWQAGRREAGMHM